jgi:exosortase A
MTRAAPASATDPGLETLDDPLPWPASWGPALTVLGVLLAVMLGVFFRTEVAAAVTVWSSSTTYNHCWLILPLALWLAWNDRARLRGLAPVAMPAAGLLALAPAAAWFLAERLGIMEGRQLAVIGLVWCCCLGILGWRVCRAMAPALIYLVFLVPFGAFVTPVLQDITAWMIDVLLDIAGIPHFVDHLIIEIPAGTFLVAEACAGLRFLIAAMAFGTLYAFVMFRSPGRRLIVLALSIIVPIIANGFRAFGIVLLGHLLGSAEAGAADHVLYGWIFFSIVILLLILAGLPFREDLEQAPPSASRNPASAPASTIARLALAGAAVLAVAASGPVMAAALQGSAIGRVPQPVMAVLPLAAMANCVGDGEGLRCRDGNRSLQARARLYVLPPGVSWAAIGPLRAVVLGAIHERDANLLISSAGGISWQASLRQDPDSPRAIAIGLWRGGAPVVGGLRGRFDHAWASLQPSGGQPAMIMVEVTPEPDSPGPNQTGSRREAELLRAILAEQGASLAAIAVERSSTRSR